MARKILGSILVLSILIFIGYLAYKQYVPEIIANELLKKTEPAFLPKKVTEKMKEIKAKTNSISSDAIKDIHRSNISLEQVLKAIDDATEEKANILLDEINRLEDPKSADQIFDLAKKHFPVDFDVEALREPFLAKADSLNLKKAIRKANEYRDNKLIDFESAKIIIKRILIEKEKEFNQQVNREQ